MPPLIKKCARCGNDFACNPANITACQCSSISFTETEKDFISQQGYNDCLCIYCLKTLKELAAQQNASNQNQQMNLEQKIIDSEQRIFKAVFPSDTNHYDT